VTAPAGTQVALPAELLTQSVNDAGFSSNTACEWTCTRNNHVITSLHQRATPVSTLAANFTANVTAGTIPLAVRFTDTSAGNPTAWLWDFGDGATSTEQHPVHTYTAAGTYTVNLTVENPFGANYTVRSDYIVVGELPLADFDAYPTSGIAPLTVQFTDRSSGARSTWNWTFGDGSTSTEQHPTHEYASAGDYTVSLRIANAWGENTTVKNDYIHVGTLPVANFSASVTAGTAPLTVRFTDTSTGEVTAWSWEFGDGAVSTEQNPIHTYTTAGVYTVRLNASNTYGYSISTPTTITVLEPLVANFTANATTGPAPFVVQFADASTGNPTSWLWSFGDGNTSTEQHPVHTYTAAGTYTVNLTVSTASGSAAFSRPDYITVARVKGDFNGDGIVDIGDVSKVAYMVVGKEPEDLAADFNGNGKVDIGDAAKIACYLVGKIPAL